MSSYTERAPDARAPVSNRFITVSYARSRAATDSPTGGPSSPYALTLASARRVGRTASGIDRIVGVAQLGERLLATGRRAASPTPRPRAQGVWIARPRKRPSTKSTARRTRAPRTASVGNVKRSRRVPGQPREPSTSTWSRLAERRLGETHLAVDRIGKPRACRCAVSQRTRASARRYGRTIPTSSGADAGAEHREQLLPDELERPAWLPPPSKKKRNSAVDRLRRDRCVGEECALEMGERGVSSVAVAWLAAPRCAGPASRERS